MLKDERKYFFTHHMVKLWNVFPEPPSWKVSEMELDKIMDNKAVNEYYP